MFSTLKTCINGDSCQFAHGLKELTVDYKPNEWVKIFNQNSQSALKLPNLSTTQSEFRKSQDSSKFKTTRNSKFLTAQDDEVVSINKIINTVFLNSFSNPIERKNPIDRSLHHKRSRE